MKTILIALGAIGLLAVSVTFLGASRTSAEEQTMEATFARLYGKAEQNGEDALTPDERTFVHAWQLHSYFWVDGLDGGLANLGRDEAVKRLPALTEIGLPEVRAIIEDFMTWAHTEYDPEMTQAETDAYFKRIDAARKEMGEAGWNAFEEKLAAWWAGRPG
ncbi:MAG: DMP19 family protein [Pseudooceanicola sp.]